MKRILWLVLFCFSSTHMWKISSSSTNNPQFRLNLNDEDGAEVQAMMFCAENMSSDDIDLCVSKVLEKVYAQAPHLRPKDDDKDASTFSRTLTFRGVDYKVL